MKNKYNLLIGILIIVPLFSCSSQTTQVIGVVEKVEPERVLGGYKQKVTYSYLYQDSTYYRKVVRGNRFELLKESDSLIVELSLDDVSDGKILRRLKPIDQTPIKTYKIDSNQSSSDTLNSSRRPTLDSLLLIGNGTKLLIDYNDKDVYLYDLLKDKPYMDSYENDFKDFFVKNSAFLKQKSDELEELYFSFTITNKGMAEELNILTENNSKEAISELRKLFKKEMPKWKPGIHNGEPVNTLISVALYY